MKMYLAIPYSGLEELSFKTVNMIAGRLMEKGHIVYSPISQNHPIAKAVNLPTDWEFWKKLDEPFIDWCDNLVVVMLPTWTESIGVQAEISIAQKKGKDIIYVHPCAFL